MVGLITPLGTGGSPTVIFGSLMTLIHILEALVSRITCLSSWCERLMLGQSEWIANQIPHSGAKQFWDFGCVIFYFMLCSCNYVCLFLFMLSSDISRAWPCLYRGELDSLVLYGFQPSLVCVCE